MTEIQYEKIVNRLIMLYSQLGNLIRRFVMIFHERLIC